MMADGAHSIDQEVLEREISAGVPIIKAPDKIIPLPNVGAGNLKLPFTSLSQVDADLAMARAMQYQERAYMFIRKGDGSDFGSSGSGSYDEDSHNDEDDFVEETDLGVGHWQVAQSPLNGTSKDETLDGLLFESDEAFARALQDKEDRETTALMALAGIHDWERAEYESDSDTSQDMWQDVDPDNMSYEELVALGEAVGTHNKGLATHVIEALPSSCYVQEKRDGNDATEQCVICRHEYEEGESMLTLPCRHEYHSDCIQQWLRINKVCPVCNAEVFLADHEDLQKQVGGDDKEGSTH